MTATNISTAGIIPASILLSEPRPAWLETWGGFASTTSYADLSQDLIAQAKLVILDCIAAIAAGMQEPEVQRLADRMAARGRGTVAVIGKGISLRGDDAAFINGIAGTSLELDEGNSFARGHPGIHVLPAALATALRQTRHGQDFLTAFILGYELCARIGYASRLRATAHPHGTWGTFGSALATACLEGADREALIASINVAAPLSISASLRAMLEGATVRNSYCGISNRNGMTAWDLVASGFTGEIDGTRSVYSDILSLNFNPDLMTESLGERFEIQRNYFKRHAACRFTHAALDVTRQLLGSHQDISAQTVQRVDVETYAYAAQLDNPEPSNMLGAKFSLPFALATTIIHGEASVPAFRQASVDNAQIRSLSRKVTVKENPAYTALLPEKRPAKVTVHLNDGRVISAETMTNRGDAIDPYTASEVKEKFFELLSPVWSTSHAKQILEAIETIDGASDLEDLNNLLAAPPVKES